MEAEVEGVVPTRRQQAIGVALVVSVAIIWVVAAEFIQYIFQDDSSNYNKPYMLSYICVSMFFVFLFGFLKASWRSLVRNSDNAYSNLSTEGAPVAVNEECSVPAPVDVGSAKQSKMLSFRQHIFLAMTLAPLFFTCNYTFNLGLAYTSVASSSIIATLTSLFTLILGAVTGVEKFSRIKSLAALLSVIGAIIIIRADDREGSAGDNPVLGDVVSVVSSFIYAVYTTILKSRAPTEGSINVAMLLAFIGLFTALAAWPGILALHWSGLEPFHAPSPRTLLLLVINALVGTVLSDFLWALSVVLTTPLMTTLSLSLTVPLSIVSDLVWGRKSFSARYFVGASLVFTGFILVNIAVSVARKAQPPSSTSASSS